MVTGMRIDDTRGFTLIEILIAMVLISLTLTAVFGIFSGISQTRDRLEREGREHHLARVILDRLGRELRGAYLSQSNRSTRFEGGTTVGQPTLSFTTTTDTPYGDTRAGLAVVRYRLEGSDSQLALLRGERQLFAENDEFIREHRLTDQLRKLELRYYSNGSWGNEWRPAKRALPQLVEATLTFGRDEKETIFRTAFELPATVRQP